MDESTGSTAGPICDDGHGSGSGYLALLLQMRADKTKADCAEWPQCLGTDADLPQFKGVTNVSRCPDWPDCDMPDNIGAPPGARKTVLRSPDWPYIHIPDNEFAADIRQTERCESWPNVVRQETWGS